MSKDLLVPLDGSPLAEQALPYATALARALDARVTLLDAWWPVIPEADGPHLEAVAARLRADGVAAETYVCHLPSLGEAGKVICETAVGLEGSLIAMATHGRGGLARVVMGSVATDMLRRAQVPVLLVRSEAVH
jgi:nucleotide-binding universal stress UspA family protein